MDYIGPPALNVLVVLEKAKQAKMFSICFFGYVAGVFCFGIGD